MKKMSKKLAIVVVFFFVAACGSSGNNNSTTTIAEFPTSVGVDLSTVSSTDLQNVDFSVSKVGIPSGGGMSQPIITSTSIADLVIKLSDHIFSGVASAINAEMLETSAQISGDAFGGTLKIDFADYSYDVDGDGSNDSCSGTASITSTTYACFRAWFNDTRFMIGYIQTAPTSATVGEGKAIISPTIVANATVMEELGMSDDVMIYLDWSNTAEGATDLDCYVAGELMDVEGREVNLTVARNFVNSTTATGGVDKITLWTVAYMATPQVIGVPILGQDNVTNFDVDLIYFNSQFLLNGQYLTFQNDFYYEGVQVDGTPNNEIFCGEIATGDQAGDSPGDPTLCEGEGLDITELEYLELSASDVTKTQFPEATIFSEAPTF